MNDHGITKEQLHQELIELRREYSSYKELCEQQNSIPKYANDEMLETNLKLTLAMQGGNMAWWEIDVPTGLVTFDIQKVEMLGYPPDKFKYYTDFTALVHPLDFDNIMNAMRGHYEGIYDHYEVEYRILTKSKEYIWCYDYGSVVKRDHTGKPLIVSGFVYNITNKKKSEERLLLISSAVDSASDAIGISDSQGHHFYQNKALSDLFGYDTAEEVEADGGGMGRVKDPAVAKQMFNTILQGKSWSGELDMVTKRGVIFPAYERADAIKDNEGNIIGVIGLITDITERRRAEDILLKSEIMLQTVLDNFPGVVFWKDKQSNYLGCNQSFATGSGLKSPSEIVGRTDFEMPWASTEAIKYLKDDRAVMKSGKGRLHIIETQHQANNQVIWFDTSKFPMLDSSGQVIGVIGVSNDISTLLMAEQKLIHTNKELAFENEEKEKRAAELVIANKELIFQNNEKEKRAAELVIANKELIFQYGEKEKRAEELMIAKDKAEASDRLKTAFMNNISHEIRTPLNGILGFAGLIIQPDITMEEKEEFLDILNQSGKRLINTVTDYMDISLMITDNMEVHPKPMDIALMLTNLCEYFQEASIKKNLVLTTQFPDNTDNFKIHTDEELLQKAVSKLLDNSVKFSKEGIITLGFELINNEIAIFVKDSGKGIEKHAQERIYEYFMQEDVSRTRGYEGSGLGLSIAKGIMQLLGGKISVESEVGIGSTFYFTLPYNAEPEAKEVLGKVALVEKEENQIKNLKILIAEDDNISEMLLLLIIKTFSKEVIEVRNGNDAVEICRTNPDIDLILMDIKMPLMSGYEAARQIRQFNKNVIIIAQTAFGLTGDREKAIEAGCNDYIAKPINKFQLLSLIQKYFKKE